MTKTPNPFIALRADERDKRSEILYSDRGLRNPRDSKGILWAPYGGSMEGETLFSQVHPIRQKMCMEGPYCQVCGKMLIGKFIPWILNGSSDVEQSIDLIINQQAFKTSTPPTCGTCQDIARDACHHLAAHPQAKRLIVRSYTPYGLFGDLMRSKDPEQLEDERGMVLRFGSDAYNEALPFFVAKQLVVRIERYKVLTY